MLQRLGTVGEMPVQVGPHQLPTTARAVPGSQESLCVMGDFPFLLLITFQ